MPKSCNAPRCTNSNKKGYCLTTFPQDSKIKEAWIDAAGVTDWKPTKTAALCEVHFHPSALYCVGNKKFIKKNVIPTMFCKCDEHIKRKFLAEIKSKESIESLASKKQSV
ncbi:THAP domain-containing protein [Ooceraea biroi]|uniref:THAP domain-containing protein n=1 Tax=Ooceraea biroi TaxID=2015173 RepID=A0A026WB07_OOCBI|nr:THAP domain-containing protein [Ooceraea biroi]